LQMTSGVKLPGAPHTWRVAQTQPPRWRGIRVRQRRRQVPAVLRQPPVSGPFIDPEATRGQQKQSWPAPASFCGVERPGPEGSSRSCADDIRSVTPCAPPSSHPPWSGSLLHWSPIPDSRQEHEAHISGGRDIRLGSTSQTESPFRRAVLRHSGRNCSSRWQKQESRFLRG